MKIVGRFLISLVGALAVAGAAVVGCSTTNNLNNGQGTSGPGETCTRSFDCKTGYICEQNICLAAAPTTTVDGGVLPTGDSGPAMTAPHLGLLNESCQVSSDCQSPLECLGQRCSVVNYGLTATGKSCAGECNTPADCCELPVGFDPFLGEWEAQPVDGGPFVFHPGLSTSNVRCEDLLGFIGGDATICSNPANFNVDTETLAEGCFLYNTYCGSCGASGPWACTNNQCVYTAACTQAGTVAALASTCPSETRTGRGLSTTCTVAAGATMGSCQAGCAADADCAGKVPTGSNHTCSAADAGAGGTNCTCYQSSCYFKCAGDLDCASGNTCDGATHLCKAAGCMADADCVQSLGNPRAKCVTNACQVACDNDSNCGPPATICSNGFCKASGCTSDSDCPASGGAHEFCVTATATTYTGAITN
jgi:hypothetical protein